MQKRNRKRKFIAIVLLTLMAGCTAEQLKPYKKAAGATTQAGDDPFLRTISPTVATAASLVGNVALGLLWLLEKAKRKQTEKPVILTEPPTTLP